MHTPDLPPAHHAADLATITALLLSVFAALPTWLAAAASTAALVYYCKMIVRLNRQERDDEKN